MTSDALRRAAIGFSRAAPERLRNLVSVAFMAASPHQFSAFARSVTTRSGDGASQLEAECALIEVSAPIESPLAGSTGESARSACHGPVASPMDDARACRAAHVVGPLELERVTIGCGQFLNVLIHKPSGATAVRT